ncbi:MAG: lipocalin-like domain-containing protein [Betaproteobacteria bacterium]
MKQVRKLIAISSFMVGMVTLTHHAGAQQKSQQEQLVGAWTLVSADSVRTDGSKVAVFGSNPKGTMGFSGDGHFALVQMRGDIPRLASNSRDQGTSDEYKAIVGGSLAYFGTYSLNEADKIISIQLEGSTFANLMGGEQKRIITNLTADELTFTNPRNPSGTTLEVTWKRAR